MKKLLLIVLGIILILLLGLGVFYFFGGKEKASNFFNEGADFGSFFDTNTTSQNDTEFTIPESEPIPTVPANYKAPVLRQISFEPVSGYTYFATTSTSTRTTITEEQANLTEDFLATSTVVRFQERATGHIYDVFEFTAMIQKVSNITIQKIYNTVFTASRNIFLYQIPTAGNEQIKTVFAQNIPAYTVTNASSTTEFPQSIEQKDISNILNNLVYLKENGTIAYSINTLTGADVYTSDPERLSEKKVTSLPFSEFTLEKVNSNTLLLQSKASASTIGYAYTLNISTGSLTKFAGNTRGLLTKISPDFNTFLSSESSTSRPILRAHDVKTNTVRRVGIDTIPEKCTFSQVNSFELYCFASLQYKSATYPDDWYKGKVFNIEDLYKINLETGVVDAVYIFGDDLNIDFDATKVEVTNNDNFILFVNKYDLTLWSLNLSELNNQF